MLPEPLLTKGIKPIAVLARPCCSPSNCSGSIVGGVFTQRVSDRVDFAIAGRSCNGRCHGSIAFVFASLAPGLRATIRRSIGRTRYASWVGVCVYWTCFDNVFATCRRRAFMCGTCAYLLLQSISIARFLPVLAFLNTRSTCSVLAFLNTRSTCSVLACAR